MPTFGYRCTECSEELETTLPTGVEPTTESWPCDETPGCKGTFKRVYSFGGFILKGKGWASKD